LDRDAAGVTRAAAACDGLALPCDLSEPEAIAAALARVSAAWGRVDLLVNNAAMMTFTPLAETDAHAFLRVLRVNLMAPFLLARGCAALMPEGGAMVNLSSVHAQATTPNVIPYATSKGGIEAMTRALAVELQPRGIRVNAVAPGAVETPMLRSNPNIASGAEKLTGPIGAPEDLAAAIAFLLSNEARYVTGSVLAVDGGRLATL
ncbi:MAG: SDR family oxidoreductase, partial [Acetobacteraceae bacterium]|nr:SDR family oxidoreductase [Acetobacteraceae bacterium]